MAPRLPIPSLPIDLLNALRVLPGMARDTARMAESTEVLTTVAADMSRVAQLTEGIERMDQRMANIEAAMPILVEVQEHLSNLPETMARLDARLNELGDRLDALQRSLEPIGTAASRIPGQRRAAKRAAAASPSETV